MNKTIGFVDVEMLKFNINILCITEDEEEFNESVKRATQRMVNIILKNRKRINRITEVK